VRVVEVLVQVVAVEGACRKVQHNRHVLWIDADAAFIDLSHDIRDELEPGKDLYLVEHRWDVPPGRRSANAGVMLLRSSDWTRAFLDAAWSNDRFVDRQWWHNAAILDLLGYAIPEDGTPPILGAPTRWHERVKLLGLEWNSTENPSAAAHPIIRHLGRRPSVELLESALVERDPAVAGALQP
jgi:hypothetical protein